MKEIYFKNLKEYLGKKICIEGFVDNIRNLQYVQFLVLRDSTGKVQVTIEKKEENLKLNEIVNGLTCESTVKVKGILSYPGTIWKATETLWKETVAFFA